MVNVLIYAVMILFVAYVGWAAMLYIMQPKLLYGPTAEVLQTPGQLGLAFEDVAFKTADGLTLRGWYIPCGQSEHTILFCHGNAGNRAHRAESMSFFHSLGLNCFIFDYRGYGDSQGKPSEEGTYLDAEAAYRWLTDRKKTPAESIIVFGRSLGGSIAAHLAGKVRAGALVVESAFTSYVDIGRTFYPYMPVRWFARFRYRTIDFITEVRCPVMLVYSRDDEIVPFELGRQLYEAANEPKELVEIFGSHNDGFLVSGDLYTQAWATWLKFLKEHTSQKAPRQSIHP